MTPRTLILKQHSTLKPGDVVFIRTGFMTLWPDAAKYRLDNQAGLSLEAAQWLVQGQQAMLLGADNFAVERFPLGQPGQLGSRTHLSVR